MSEPADSLPDDPATLKAMLLAERTRAERLAQIIKEMSVIGSAGELRRSQKISCCWALRRSSRPRPAMKPAGRPHRRASGRRELPSDGPIVAPCRTTCRGSRWWSISRITAAPAAVARCM